MNSDLLRELNETVMNAWNSWDTKHMLSKLQGTMYSHYWSVLSSKGSNSYDRRAAPKAPTVQQLSAHLEKSESNVFRSESILMQKSLQVFVLFVHFFVFLVNAFIGIISFPLVL